MKSPFTDPVIVVPDDGNGYAFAEDNEEEPRPLTLEEITFATHAINQHEKLVAVVRCLLLSADAAWEADAGGHDWPEACQLARALLKEEKT